MSTLVFSPVEPQTDSPPSAMHDSTTQSRVRS